MKSIEDQYNELIYSLAKLKNTIIEAHEFNLTVSDFKSLIDEMERNGLINAGKWLFGSQYSFRGLTFQGTSFIQNQDKKQYSKNEKTEIYNHYNVNVGGDNNGQIAIGNNNSFSSEFDKRFMDLIQGIQASQLVDKDMIIAQLKNSKSNKVELQALLGHLLTRSAEVASVVSMITGLLPLIAG